MAPHNTTNIVCRLHLHIDMQWPHNLLSIYISKSLATSRTERNVSEIYQCRTRPFRTQHVDCGVRNTWGVYLCHHKSPYYEVIRSQLVLSLALRLISFAGISWKIIDSPKFDFWVSKPVSRCVRRALTKCLYKKIEGHMSKL
jgi:hypothetical protein